ncbi:MAG: hypothetical protein WCO98_07670 [bacterium]
MSGMQAITGEVTVPSCLNLLFWVREDVTEEMLRGEIRKLNDNGVGGFIDLMKVFWVRLDGGLMQF